jgi:hypothetical protein
MRATGGFTYDQPSYYAERSHPQVSTGNNMTDDDKDKPLYNWHDEIMPEPFDTILECLDREGEKLFSAKITEKGLRIWELCDEYYGPTLTKNQLDRLIAELTAISEKLSKQSE